MWWAIGGLIAGIILCVLAFAIGWYVAARGNRPLT